MATDEELDGLVTVIRDAARGGCGSHEGCRDLIRKKQRDAARRWLAEWSAQDRAEAWDEGADAVCPNPDLCTCDGYGDPRLHEETPRNPYRAALAPPTPRRAEPGVQGGDGEGESDE